MAVESSLQTWCDYRDSGRAAPPNEPVRDYAAGSAERESLQRELQQQLTNRVSIGPVIDGRVEAADGALTVNCPHDHRHVLADLTPVDAAGLARAIDVAAHAQRSWSRWPFEERAAVFLKAADLLAGPWRDRMNAATMLGQSKTVHQAEIDAACELTDFLRLNVQFARELLAMQPYSPPGVRNGLDYRPLEGFVYAVSPFNFTAIGGNLACAPALMGNTVLWKPATTAALSNFHFMELLAEAGLPPGVIQFLPGDAQAISAQLLASPRLAGLHFTGSTGVFDALWQSVAQRLPQYASYPRLVGETGGKDFIVAHASADVAALSTALLRGAFEYQGQKCSAASRAYIPRSLWRELRERLADELARLRVGDVTQFENFMGAVIDARAFQRVRGYIERARAATHAKVAFGGGCDDSRGYFIEPTLIEATDPQYVTMCEEIFGPVLSVYVYDDADYETILRRVDTTSRYGLTGAVFARDRAAIARAADLLRHAAGNFYVNDKPTGAVVGQQPFGGARRSGTNDKAGSPLNLLRWVSPRTIKETFVPATRVEYPHMVV